jgi:hypothetical protein
MPINRQKIVLPSEITPMNVGGYSGAGMTFSKIVRLRGLNCTIKRIQPQKGLFAGSLIFLILYRGINLLFK